MKEKHFWKVIFIIVTLILSLFYYLIGGILLLLLGYFSTGFYIYIVVGEGVSFLKLVTLWLPALFNERIRDFISS